MSEPLSVDVHLVGQPWWDSAVPYVALVFSLISLGLTAYFQFRNDARIKATATVGLPFAGGRSTGAWRLKLGATNKGRTGQTVVNSIGLQRSDGSGLWKALEPTDTPMPCTLAPGAHAEYYLDVDELLSHVPDEGIDGLSIIVSTGHRDTKTRLPKDVKQKLKSIRQLKGN